MVVAFLWLCALILLSLAVQLATMSLDIMLSSVPVCHISAKCYKPPPDFASQITPVSCTMKINDAFMYYKHGSVQSTILIPFMVCYIMHMNAYSLNSVVFNEVY